MKNNGKYFERLVHLIEKSLDSSAVVEWDVDLPVLTSQIGATRQCDIVIRAGTEPRTTTTIVEVQDRGSKPSRNDFGGWIEKMKEVGAQHLICVSRIGFTKSEKEKAAQLGNSIRLIELKEIGDDKIPLDFFQMFFKIKDFDISTANFKNIKFSISKEERKKSGFHEDQFDLGIINLNDDIFSYDKTNYISAYKLIKECFVLPKENNSGSSTVSIPCNEKPLFTKYRKAYLNVQFSVDFEYRLEVIEVPASILSYEQNGHGVLAWVVEFRHTNKRGNWSLKYPVQRLPSGGFEIKAMAIDFPTDSTLSMKLISNE